MGLNKLRQTLLFAIKEAGKITLKNFNKKNDATYKGEIDLVTKIDIACEKKIISIIKKQFPDHNIITEESTIPATSSLYKWIIDPIDGTINYFHHYPFYCISIGLTYKDSLLMGAVYAPYLNELFFAQRGKGAFLNNKKIKVSCIKDINKALLVTGFPYDVRTTKNNLNHFTEFMMKAQAIRRDGSAALNLCYVACGRFEGYWELKLHAWDKAAGALILQEAGGKITGLDGASFDLYAPSVLATNKHVHKQMENIINKN